MSPQLDQYEELKNELQKLYQDEGEGAKFRSKSIWIEHGERPTKYFFNLEKRNYKRRVITKLEDGNGSDYMRNKSFRKSKPTIRIYTLLRLT